MAEKKPKERYNPGLSELKWQAFWEEQGVYRFDPASKAPVFSIDTPPPYTSATHLHVGHAMSYSQAEFVVRYQRMRGKNIFYPMGFDDNGMPTERYVEKKYNVNKSKIDRKAFIELCLKETKQVAETYKAFWKSLGLSVDWSLQYSTIDPRCRKVSQASFLDLYEKGLLERKDGPTTWCSHCQTALAQADVSILEQETPLYDISFKSSEGRNLVISTTRPELIPVCVALYVHPQDERYSQLIGGKAIVPLFDYAVPIKTDKSVDPTFGTGLMMVCTWGDYEDVTKWRRDGLEARIAIDPNGKMTALAGPYRGLSLKKAREAIVGDLKSRNLVLKSSGLVHQVGVHERCDTPVEFFKTKQWFIKALDAKNDFLKRGDELHWHPDFMKVRYNDWVEGLKWDWCISRSRYYGVPFPVWYCRSCDTPILPPPGKLPVDPLLEKAPVDACPTCGKKEIVGETDVMDTWMTSSLTPLINCHWPDDRKLQDKIYPMNLRVQAFEIIRTWLFYTVVKSHYHTNSLPWKSVMISGWGLDEQGKKMSKSLGNFVEPQSVIREHSADALRFWAAGGRLGSNLRWSPEDVANGSKLLTKLWNAAKLVFSHLEDADFSDQSLPADRLTDVDRWILARLQQVIQEATAAFEVCEYSVVKHEVNSFFWSDLCDNYLELIKNRFWNEELYGSKVKETTQQVAYQVLLAILKLYAPIVPHITEELYQRYYRKSEKDASLHAASWPEVNERLFNEQALMAGDAIKEVISLVRKHKSVNSLGIGATLKNITIDTDAAHRKRLEGSLLDIRLACRADKINFGTADQYVSETLPIKVAVD